MSFRTNLKNELNYQDIEIKELAGKIGIPYTTLLTYVNHRECLPKIDIAMKIADALNVSLEYLITGRTEDNYKKRFIPIYKELSSLPLPVINSFEKLIHIFYELYNNKGV